MQTTHLILHVDKIYSWHKEGKFNITVTILLNVGIILAILVENSVLKRDYWSNYLYLFIGKLMLTIQYMYFSSAS